MSGLEASLRTHSGSLCFTLDGSFQEMESCTVYLPDPIRDGSETVTVVSAEINRSRTCVRGAALHPANDRDVPFLFIKLQKETVNEENLIVW